MSPNEVPNGMQAAWNQFDGHTMAGRVIDSAIGARNAMVERVDGSVVSVAYLRLRPATPADTLKACEFFGR